MHFVSIQIESRVPTSCHLLAVIHAMIVCSNATILFYVTHCWPICFIYTSHKHTRSTPNRCSCPNITFTATPTHGVALRVVWFGLDFQPKLKIDVRSLLTNKMPLWWFLDAMLIFLSIWCVPTPYHPTCVTVSSTLLPSGFGVKPSYHSNPHFCGR